jgi:hypothetical protein
MILFVQKYTTGNDARDAELATCAEENKACDFFDEIVWVDGNHKRWRYIDFFDMAAKDYAGEQCVLANSDISFRHPSCELLRTVVSRAAFVALTRWHDNVAPWMIGKHHGYRWYSGTQDVWGFIGGMFAGMGDIPLGEPGCDCRLVAEIAMSGAAVWNPALTIKTMHVHKEPNELARDSPAGVYGFAELSTFEGFGRVLLKEHPESQLIEYVTRARVS